MNIKEQTIAHIGLGRMGSGIAKNIQAAGCHFIVYNRSTEKMQPFVATGAKAARTPREAAMEADVVVTSLMDDKSVFDVMLGEDGLLAGMRGGAIPRGDAVAFPVTSEGRRPDPPTFRSSIARPTDTSIYASSATSRCRSQDSRPGWIRCSPFL